MSSKKNNSVADQLRIAGNELYKACRFHEALARYNRSLCHAIPGSVEFALAFANRSAVYMELEEYELCLENIKLAIECGYPKDKIETLQVRQEKCLDLLEVEPDSFGNPWNFFKLSKPTNEKIPFIAKSIEIKSSEKFGRHLVTNEALKAGEVICIEEPFYKFIANEARFSRCVNCLKSAKMNLYPCCECTYVMFCSESCMQLAKRFHQFECKRIDINPDDDDNIFQFAHRAVFEALGIFGTIEKLQKFIEKFSEAETIFNFDLTKADKHQTEKFLLRTMNSLQRNKIPNKMKSLMDRHVDLMKSITKNPKHQKFLDGFMRKQMEIVITNSYGLTEENGKIFGSGIFPLASFFNHSCAPNVARVTVDNKLVFIVSRPIEKHQQLFLCYRDDFTTVPRAERQAELLKSYNFICKCEACERNYPTVNITPKKLSSSSSALQTEFKVNCDCINKHIKKFPSDDLVQLVERNQTILEQIACFATHA